MPRSLSQFGSPWLHEHAHQRVDTGSILPWLGSHRRHFAGEESFHFPDRPVLWSPPGQITQDSGREACACFCVLIVVMFCACAAGACGCPASHGQASGRLCLIRPYCDDIDMRWGMGKRKCTEAATRRSVQGYCQSPPSVEARALWLPINVPAMSNTIAWILPLDDISSSPPVGTYLAQLNAWRQGLTDRLSSFVPKWPAAPSCWSIGERGVYQQLSASGRNSPAVNLHSSQVGAMLMYLMRSVVFKRDRQTDRGKATAWKNNSNVRRAIK